MSHCCIALVRKGWSPLCAYALASFSLVGKGGPCVPYMRLMYAYVTKRRWNMESVGRSSVSVLPSAFFVLSDKRRETRVEWREIVAESDICRWMANLPDRSTRSASYLFVSLCPRAPTHNTHSQNTMRSFHPSPLRFNQKIPVKILLFNVAITLHTIRALEGSQKKGRWMARVLWHNPNSP